MTLKQPMIRPHRRRVFWLMATPLLLGVLYMVWGYSFTFEKTNSTGTEIWRSTRYGLFGYAYRFTTLDAATGAMIRTEFEWHPGGLVASLFVTAVLALLVVWRYKSVSRLRTGWWLCDACGYDVSHSGGNYCPECGAQVRGPF